MLESAMDSYTRKALTIIFVICGVCAFLFHEHDTLDRFARMSGYVGGIIALTLVIGFYLSRKVKKRKPARKESPEATNHIRQALNIMYGMDDGSRHYHDLPPKIREKSLFGGKMLNKRPPDDEGK